MVHCHLYLLFSNQTHRSLFLRQMAMLGSSVTLDIVKELMEEEAISAADATGSVSLLFDFIFFNRSFVNQNNFK